MKEPMFKLAVISGPELVPSFKPYVSMTLGVQVATETPGSSMAQAQMRRLEATFGSFGPSDMFSVNRHLKVRWYSYNGETSLYCSYYKERPGDVDATGEMIVEKMTEFIDGLKLKEDPKFHVGFPATDFERRYWLPYILGVTNDCPTP